TEAGDDRATDSSEWVAVSRDDLVNDGDRDPTLDFGFTPKTYAIGDVVWIDTNKDGLQGDTEYTLKGVIVRLFDANGTQIAETKTDANGLYVFDELRAGTYRVQFELTPAQAKIYSFTKTGGGNTALDSNAGKNGFSTWITLDDTNPDLTLDYEYSDLVGGITATQGIDPTWDAGVIVLDTPVDPGPKPEKPTPGTPGSPDPEGTPGHPTDAVTLGGLPVTGGSFEWGFAAGGVALLLLGAGALLLQGRRRKARHA
ncbi:SdrD B-like domain-containing protein, partial [Leucobacter luti]